MHMSLFDLCNILSEMPHDEKLAESSFGMRYKSDCQYKIRINLRLLCQSLTDSFDYGNDEFALTLTLFRYYLNKKKWYSMV